MDNGWIKLHRKLRNWEWYQDSQVVHLFLHLLLSANHQEKTWQGQLVKSGQLITGRKALSADTGISEQSIRTALAKLVRSRVISIKSTSKFSIITIIKWANYQIELENQPANQPAINQQLTTNKNVKKEKNNNTTLGGKPPKVISSSKESKISTKLVKILKDFTLTGKLDGKGGAYARKNVYPAKRVAKDLVEYLNHGRSEKLNPDNEAHHAEIEKQFANLLQTLDDFDKKNSTSMAYIENNLQKIITKAINNK